MNAESASRAWPALALLCALTFLAGLGRQAISDSDEAFYAEAGREMVTGGDWITPHYNFDVRLQKPILYYWLVAGTYAVAGVGEAQARLWSAMSGIGLALIAAAVGRRWFSPAAGLIAGAIAATSFGVTMLARMALPDTPLAFFVTLAIWAAFEALGAPPDSASPTRPADTRGTQRAWLLLCGLSLGLGVLTKGPVALILFAIIVPPVYAWERRRRPANYSAARPLHLADVALGSALAAAIALPWFAAVTHAQGAGYLRQFLIGENVDRFATTQNNDIRSIWFYVPVVAGGLLPWTPFGLLCLPPLARVLTRRRRLTCLESRLAIWALAPLLFFTISIGKQPRYVLPCLVPLAIAVAASLWTHLSRRVDGERRRTSLVSVATVLTGAGLIALGAALLRVGPVFSAATSWSPVGPWLVVLSGAAIASWPWIGRRRSLPLAVTAAAAATGLVVQFSVYAHGRPEPVELIAAAAAHESNGSPICACGAFARNLNFYSHTRTVVGDPDSEIEQFLSGSSRVVAVIDQRTLRRIETKWDRRLPEIWEIAYLNVAALRLHDVLDPDPARVIQRVILVANR